MDNVQNNSNDLQKSLPYIAAAVALFLFIWIVPNPLYILGGGTVIGYVVWHISEKKREAREGQARASSYANICGPVVIASTHPNETVQEVAVRARDFQDQMRISGNPYWLQIPVIEYPYQPMIFGVGQLTAAWNIYQRLAGEKQHQANIEWRDGKCPAQLLPIFSSQVMPTPEQVVNNQN